MVYSNTAHIFLPQVSQLVQFEGLQVSVNSCANFVIKICCVSNVTEVTNKCQVLYKKEREREREREEGRERERERGVTVDCLRRLNSLTIIECYTAAIYITTYI